MVSRSKRKKAYPYGISVNAQPGGSKHIRISERPAEGALLLVWGLLQPIERERLASLRS